MVQPLTWKLLSSTFTWYKIKVASFDEFWCLVKKLDIKQIRVIQKSTKEDASTSDAQKQYSEFVPVFSLSLSRNAAIKAVLFAYNLSFSSRIADSSTIPTLEKNKDHENLIIKMSHSCIMVLWILSQIECNTVIWR